MKNLEANQTEFFGLEEMTVNEMENTEGGFTFSFFGIFHIHGFLDGTPGNARAHWGAPE